MNPGIGIGPTLGSLEIRLTQDLLTPFYIAAAAHTLLTLYIWFIMPESLSHEAMQRITEQHAADQKSRFEAEARAKADGSWTIWYRLRVILSIFSPLAVFIPRKREIGERGRGRDWNLTYLAVSYGILMSYMVCSQHRTCRTLTLTGISLRV